LEMRWHASCRKSSSSMGVQRFKKSNASLLYTGACLLPKLLARCSHLICGMEAEFFQALAATPKPGRSALWLPHPSLGGVRFGCHTQAWEERASMRFGTSSLCSPKMTPTSKASFSLLLHSTEGLLQKTRHHTRYYGTVCARLLWLASMLLGHCSEGAALRFSPQQFVTSCVRRMLLLAKGRL
jgi:hypothetical protein